MVFRKYYHAQVVYLILIAKIRFFAQREASVKKNIGKERLLLPFQCYFSIYFYICGQTSKQTLIMQTILNDIELDLAELKCLIQAMHTASDPSLAKVAQRNIQQMQRHLEDLAEALRGLDDAKVPPSEPLRQTLSTPAPPSPAPQAAILAERIRPAGDLRHALSLNDVFRFSRELFGGDTARMNQVLAQLEQAPTLDEALQTFTREVRPEDGNEAANDFTELLKKYFDR